MAKEESESRPLRRKTTLTREEAWDWKYYLQWYRQNGWDESEADMNAWYDLQQKYPRLKRFAGCTP
jgi:Zn-dependent oligopeptidase